MRHVLLWIMDLGTNGNTKNTHVYPSMTTSASENPKKFKMRDDKKLKKKNHSGIQMDQPFGFQAWKIVLYSYPVGEHVNTSLLKVPQTKHLMSFRFFKGDTRCLFSTSWYDSLGSS